MEQRERIERLFKEYSNALDALIRSINIEKDEVFQQNENYLEIARNSTIQCFEFTYEVLWKLFKNIAEEQGFKVNSPRDAFNAGFKLEFIEERFEQTFFEMIKKRNMTVHIYKKEIAIEIYEYVKNEALKGFLSIKSKIKNFLN